ncbi:hypothetical protein [Ferviditalea candida]|uniref:Uncharacterized protein n=1 Tax=Ferviditalea candida TaxID=3108399 RepID=A0ABU5ZI46_9BACL|nr:hypothetical protein [Paenibacillaceae bacterium T2]
MKQILVFILFAALLSWAMFSPIYKHVLIVRQAVLQQEVDYLLEVGANASHGCIDSSMLAESKSRLADRGFQTEKLIYDVTTTSGVDGTNPGDPVIRGTGIQLEISYPYEKLFEIDRLIGVAPPNPQSRMRATGVKMSEYVP